MSQRLGGRDAIHDHFIRICNARAIVNTDQFERNPSVYLYDGRQDLTTGSMLYKIRAQFRHDEIDLIQFLGIKCALDSYFMYFLFYYGQIAPVICVKTYMRNINHLPI